ncbi:hypothetical protein NFI96_007205 [Prochilodus magdalenae]|nr:hypothetical protein NFI96_007205 [Prochilodus magdalenae]
MFLYPAYRQLLKQAPPVGKTIKVWTEETDLVLQDCFDTTDWEVFRTAAVGEDCTVDLEDYASGVTSYISTCIETIVPTKRCRTYPNQKPWINCDVRSMLRARSTAFLSGNAEDYKRARYDLRRSIRQAKRQYRVKLEGCYTSADSRRMWQGLRHITDYQQRSREVTTSHTTLPDELNEFYARFEALNPDTQRGVMAEGSTQNSSLAVTSVEVCKTLKKINPRKAAGPDNIPGHALKVCSGMFVDIFNLSLAQSFVPSCFKTTIIVPLPKKSVVTCLNDYRPVALTPIVMKCFERIVMSHIQETIPDTLDPLQFVCHQNRSTDDAVNTAIHTALTHLEGKDTYVRKLFSTDPPGLCAEPPPVHTLHRGGEGENLQFPRCSHQRGFNLVTQHALHRPEVPAVVVFSEKAEEIWHVSPNSQSTIESFLTSSITVVYRNCTAQDRKALQRVIKTAQSISGAAFPSLQDIYRTRVIRRAHSIIRDSTHPQHSFFTLLPSG